MEPSFDILQFAYPSRRDPWAGRSSSDWPKLRRSRLVARAGEAGAISRGLGRYAAGHPVRRDSRVTSVLKATALAVVGATETVSDARLALLSYVARPLLDAWASRWSARSRADARLGDLGRCAAAQRVRRASKRATAMKSARCRLIRCSQLGSRTRSRPRRPIGGVQTAALAVVGERERAWPSRGSASMCSRKLAPTPECIVVVPAGRLIERSRPREISTRPFAAEDARARRSRG